MYCKTEVVLYTAKVRFFKQITTGDRRCEVRCGCFVYRKGTIFQANHNKYKEVMFKQQSGPGK